MLGTLYTRAQRKGFPENASCDLKRAFLKRNAEVIRAVTVTSLGALQGPSPRWHCVTRCLAAAGARLVIKAQYHYTSAVSQGLC